MTVPMEYRNASRHFDAFLADAAEQAGLVTRNQSYTMVEGVLHAFRRRLTVAQAIAFAQGLPPMLRALFVWNWNTDEPRAESWDRTEMTREIQALRRHHNFAPDTAIGDVAAALRRHVDTEAFEACLSGLPEAARTYWSC